MERTAVSHVDIAFPSPSIFLHLTKNMVVSEDILGSPLRTYLVLTFKFRILFFV